ncbi:hypothetical protein [Pseudalkalibacillus hwajinpoensis]|uniref:DUF4064 domain-containing protein n=1 Tax=Guptibacillus hwajinpoensis TaxID=208199 RepID=A0A4U1MN99_9BACL|nr:hypothetical protein [Pseudalkalibacillus hwajinpoensis]TKD72155.1 hypothetical protein FBF83_04975 [Pseudalkalibacillus hwajinpoensis]
MTKTSSSINGSSTFISIVSIAAAGLAAIIAGSFLSGMIEIEPINKQFFPVILPILICAVGIILGLTAYRLSKRKIAITGIILNAVVVFIPVTYLVM